MPSSKGINNTALIINRSQVYEDGRVLINCLRNPSYTFACALRDAK